MSGDWDPHWIGDASHRLYAALHAVPGTPTTGIVLVPPLLHELPRTRRFLTEIASELAKTGLPSLRFDFQGTGDSGGGGEELDFSTIRRDLDLAIAALRELTGVSRVCVCAWRGSALALRGWAEQGGAADLLVLWEPIIDGADWLQRLQESDARERATRPPARPGVPRITDRADGQLMGFTASRALLADLAHSRLDSVRGTRLPIWLIARPNPGAVPEGVDNVLSLPPGAPAFSTDAAMDATFFVTPPVRELVGQLGRAVQMEVRA